MLKHRFNIFPEMMPEDYQRLHNDISQNGFDEIQPIYIYEGAILDGWNRYKACNELKVKPKYCNFSGDDADALNFVMRTNKRRNLTSSQWATIAVEAEDLINLISSEVERARREKISERENVGNQYKKVEMGQLIDPYPKDNSARATAKIAEAFNTNRTYVSDAAKLKETEPELFEQVKSGEKTMPQVKNEIRKKQEVALREKYKELNPEPFPLKKYSVIYADPPWPVQSIIMNKWESPIIDKYPTMTIDEIKALPIEDLADENCSLFLWTTHTFLPVSFELLQQWGFKYHCLITWNKGSGWTQFGFHKMTEFIIFGYKGNMNIEQRGKAIPTLINEAKTFHSRKPDLVRDLIKFKTPENRIELFARQKDMDTGKKYNINFDGWDLWGNQVNSENNE